MWFFKQPRHDRYEGKPLYWIEEEVEIEWEKVASRSRAEQSEYQVAASAEDVLTSSLDTLQVDMKMVGGGLDICGGWMGPNFIPCYIPSAERDPFLYTTYFTIYYFWCVWARCMIHNEQLEKTITGFLISNLFLCKYICCQIIEYNLRLEIDKVVFAGVHRFLSSSAAAI